MAKSLPRAVKSPVLQIRTVDALLGTRANYGIVGAATRHAVFRSELE